MSRLGQWSGTGAATLGLITVATWNLGGASSANDPQLEGRQLLQAKGCAACHAGPETIASFDVGFPSLANASDWAGARRPGLSASEYLVESISAPGAFISPDFRAGRAGPATAMPQLRLSSEEIASLVDYLLRG